MKSITSFCLFLTISLTAFAQSSNDLEAINTSNVEKVIVESKTSIKSAHTNLAMEQINAFIAKELKYSEELKDYGIEGSLELILVIDENGMITGKRVSNSTSKSLSEHVLNLTEELKAIKCRKNEYKGASTIKLPLRFSL